MPLIIQLIASSIYRLQNLLLFIFANSLSIFSSPYLRFSVDTSACKFVESLCNGKAYTADSSCQTMLKSRTGQGCTFILFAARFSEELRRQSILAFAGVSDWFCMQELNILIWFTHQMVMHRIKPLLSSQGRKWCSKKSLLNGDGVSFVSAVPF
ncbi:hypothetical protein SAY87_022250 [Trapa incisa]|uniref:Uncharacterized protein n=1 Tax=Trapa incisa TaxID=236973 RepID=A0AAN7PSC8_9MYRT|nr:hypothetical protein SAY87_022250 [Trapa incisa]